MQPISPNYNWENGVKQIKITEENLSQSCILCQLLRTKTLASGSKCIKHFILFLPLFALYLLSGWVDVIYLRCLVFLKFPWWLVWIFCAPILLNLKNKITKIEHKKIFCGSSKILKNISWPINICLKYFMTPTKTLSCHVFPSSSLCYSICSYIISSRPAFNLSSLLLCPLNSLSHSLNQFDIRRFPSGLLLL